MIELKDDKLTFTFPEIEKQISELLEQHILQVLPKFQIPEDRVDRLRFFKSFLRKLISKREYCVRENNEARLLHFAMSLTQADVEKAYRESAIKAAGLDNGSPARLSVEFQRTLRIPDDGETYPLPAGLGQFPLRSVDDFAETTPDSWVKRGGVLMPMYQSEALWIWFSSQYPFAVKIAAGKINAVSGDPWTSDLQQEPQNYVVTPRQPWLDGFAIGEGLIRQFVAMPLGEGYSVEEQLTGKADVGGIQVQAYPMSAEVYFREEVVKSLPLSLKGLLPRLLSDFLVKRDEEWRYMRCQSVMRPMGLGAGGKMRQEIYHDHNPLTAWDQTQTRRCFIHLCNSMVWRQVTGTNPPKPPLTSEEYKRAGIPWFDYYRDDQKALKGSKQLAGVKSVAQIGEEKQSQPLPDNSSIAPERIVQYGNARRPGEIREFLDTP